MYVHGNLVYVVGDGFWIIDVANKVFLVLVGSCSWLCVGLIMPNNAYDRVLWKDTRFFLGGGWLNYFFMSLDIIDLIKFIDLWGSGDVKFMVL